MVDDHASGRAPDDIEPSSFAVDISRDGRSATVAVIGELDLATAPELLDVVASVDWGDVDELLVDLSQLQFIDAPGLRGLVGMANHIATSSRARIIDAPPAARRLFAIVGLDGRFALD